MPLVPQTSAGLSTADSYVTRDEANTYFAGRGAPAEWTALTDVDDGGRDAALRYALRTLDARYAWRGSLVNFGPPRQSTAWPRYAVIDNEGASISVDAGGTPVIPELVKQAQIELALAHAKAAVNEVLARGGRIESATIGPMSVKFSEGAPVVATYPYVDWLLRDFATPVDAGGGWGETQLIFGAP